MAGFMALAVALKCIGRWNTAANDPWLTIYTVLVAATAAKSLSTAAVLAGTDCGLLLYDREGQDMHAGGSGCGCAASTLSAHFLPRLQDGTMKRILFVPTGALLSTVSFNEGQSIPGIAHGVVLESGGK